MSDIQKQAEDYAKSLQRAISNPIWLDNIETAFIAGASSRDGKIEELKKENERLATIIKDCRAAITGHKNEISKAEHLLNLSQAELRAMYKRVGIKGSNVLSLIDEYLNSPLKYNI